MKKLFSILAAAMLVGAFAGPINAAPIFVPSSEQVDTSNYRRFPAGRIGMRFGTSRLAAIPADWRRLGLMPIADFGVAGGGLAA
jgi:hypothetical protein